MRHTVYYQRDALDPIHDEEIILSIVRAYVPNAKALKYVDESGGEARTYAVDDNIILKVQRPQQLRSSTSLEKEVFFLRELEKQTDVNVPHVLGYGRHGTIEYICMTRMPGVAADRVKMSTQEKNAFLFDLGKELRKIHSIDQSPFAESGLFPQDDPFDLVERLQLRYQTAIQKNKETISSEKREFTLGEIVRKLEQIQNTDGFVALHVNPYIPHVFLNEMTHKYTGIIDFGDSYVGHPIFDMWYWSVASRKILLSGYTSEKPVSDAFKIIFDTVNNISQMVNELKKLK